jgi:hypothetical protein
MKKEHKQLIITSLGCLLAVVMICAQLFIYLNHATPGKQITKTEQQSSGDEKTETIVMGSYSLPSPIHVQLNLDPHVLFTIIFEDECEKETPAAETSSVSQKLLVTLFRVIISPNAP